jgi:hypothetical protein
MVGQVWGIGQGQPAHLMVMPEQEGRMIYIAAE